MKKNIITLCSVVLCITTLLGMLPMTAFADGTPSVSDFTDLKNDWSLAPISWCVENGIMNGMSPDTFVPNGTVSRAQFVTALSRLADKLDFQLNGYTYAQGLPDVENNQWYTKGVAWAYKNAIVLGYDDGTFGPWKNITREQVAVLIHRFIDQYLAYQGLKNAPAADGLYGDYGEVSDYAKDAIAAMAKSEIMLGTSGSFYPKNSITRAEMAAVLQRLHTFTDKDGVITDYSYLKQGINIYTYHESCTFRGVCSANGEEVNGKTIFEDLTAAGMDYVRIPLSVTYSRDNVDDPNLMISYQKNFTKDVNGQYSLSLYEDQLKNAVILCQQAADAGLSVILDLHEYDSYANLILHYDTEIPKVKEEISSLISYINSNGSDQTYTQREKLRLDGMVSQMKEQDEDVSDLQSDLIRLDTMLADFKTDPDQAAQNYFVLFGMSDYFFQSFTTISQEILADIYETPNCETDLYAALWSQIATAFRDFDGRLMFELINEKELSNASVIAATDAIRGAGGTNAERMIIVYSYCWQYYNANTGEPLSTEREKWDFGAYNDDPNLMFDIHNYSPTAYTESDPLTPRTWNNKWFEPEVTSQKAIQCRAQNLAKMECRMKAASDLRERTGRNVIIGEYGARKWLDNRETYFRDFMTYAAKYHLPTCIWAAGFDSDNDSSNDINTVPQEQKKHCTSLTTYYYNDGRWAKGTLEGIFG